MKQTLQRKLGLWTASSIVIGSVVGSSIFMKPAVMAQQLPSPLLLLAVWMVAGGVSLIGAMINAEIGCIYPETGGQYVYFRRLYGNFFAYLYGWSAFVVINTASVAAIAFVFAQFSEAFVSLPRFSTETEQSFAWTIPFLGRLFPLQNAGVKGLAILLILLMTLVNVRSVKTGGAVQVFFTVLKVAALLLLLAFLFGGNGSVKNLWENPPAFTATFWPLFLGAIAATSGALASYDGWINLSFISGEITHPQRNIPRSLLFGLGLCMVLYILTTLAYLYVIPVAEMKSSSLVAADAMQRAGGKAGGAFIAILVMLSCAGAVNGNIMPCARVSFAMAQDRLFFSGIQKVHPHFDTPANALWLHCAWTSLFVITGSFDMLADLFVFVSWIFYGFGAYAIFIVRKKHKAIDGGLRMKGYPVLPVIFLFFSLLYFVMTIYNDVQNYASGKTPVINSLLGLVLVLVGLPFYWWFRRTQVSGADQ